ncbi:hypothetical protein AAA214_11900 [Parabacteroides goldsteinii]|uniref:hypothetical protein n=1 Tax=Parabacteroides goldsteinii TaxID=328812 RepID=UPI0032C0F535
MKLQNIFALIVTLIGFAACTSESELLDTPVENSDLVPVTISLGSIQTKASVGLDTDEGTIQNAVIGIFDSNGIPTVAPIVLTSSTNGTTRLPLVKSNAYAFVNVSDEDIEALKSFSSMNEFKNYPITKQLTQDAAALPKFGEKTNFTPTANGNIEIPVHQLTARLDVSVEVIVMENEQDVTNQHPEIQFTKSSLSWTNILNKTANTTVEGNSGSFTTTIDKDYNVINRTYSYPGAMPTLSLTGTIDGKVYDRSYTFGSSLSADHVYVVLMKATVHLNTEITVSFDYEIIKKDPVTVDVPSFD